MVRRGRPADSPFMAFYLADRRLRAALAVNQTRELGALKRLIPAGVVADPAALSDESTSLNALLPRPS